MTSESDLSCPRSSGSIEDKYAAGGLTALSAEEKQQLYARHSIEDLRDISHGKPIGYYRRIDNAAAARGNYIAPENY